MHKIFPRGKRSLLESYAEGKRKREKRDNEAGPPSNFVLSSAK